MVDSGYHPLKHHPLRIVLGWWTVDIILLSIITLRIVLVWWTVDIILLSIILLGQCLDSGYLASWDRNGGQWISSS